MARSRLYPFLDFQSGVDWQRTDVALLRSLNRLGMQNHKTITVTSGYRSVAEQQYLWDNAARLGLVRGKTVAKPGSSDHNFGRAVDAVVNGVEIGKVFSQAQFAKVGLRFLAGDKVHVTFSGKGGGTTKDAPAATVPPDTQSASPEPAAGAPADAPEIVPPAQSPPPTALGAPATGLAAPGSVDYTLNPHHEVYGLWQQAASGSEVSPETSALLRNAQLSAGV